MSFPFWHNIQPDILLGGQSVSTPSPKACSDDLFRGRDRHRQSSYTVMQAVRLVLGHRPVLFRFVTSAYGLDKIRRTASILRACSDSRNSVKQHKYLPNFIWVYTKLRDCKLYNLARKHDSSHWYSQYVALSANLW